MFGAVSFMVERRRIESAEFQEGVALMCYRVETLASRKGIPDAEYFDLQGALSALPPSRRGRASVMLEGIALQSFDESPATAFAARYVRALADDVWNTADRLF